MSAPRDVPRGAGKSTKEGKAAMGQLNLPQGKKIAVNLGVDFDAQSLWLGAFNMPTPAMMARGEFGAMVGVPRLLELYRKYDIKTTWFTPGHTIDTFPDVCKEIQARYRGAAHGACPRYVR
jgi:peptidoglycan-N-acetylglucosamine deacetylase